MEHLREIMSNLVNIEYALGAFAALLDALEEIYDIKHEEELKQNVWTFRMIVHSLENELSDNITEIDRFLIEHRDK